MELEPVPSVVPIVEQITKDNHRLGLKINHQWSKWLNTVYEKIRGPLWEDNLASLTPGKVPASAAPTWAAFGPSAICFQWAFSVNDHIQTSGFHITHDIKPGSKIYPHVHWSTDGTSTNTVKWELSFTYAKGHNQEAFPADSTLQIEQAASGTAWQHMITEVSDAQAVTAPEVDSIIIMDVKRITNGGTDNADTVFGLFVDIHYQKDRFGTPQKSPDFYVR